MCPDDKSWLAGGVCWLWSWPDLGIGNRAVAVRDADVWVRNGVLNLHCSRTTTLLQAVSNSSQTVLARYSVAVYFQFAQYARRAFVTYETPLPSQISLSDSAAFAVILA